MILRLKKENGVVTIGYFKKAPIDCVKIKDDKIIYTCFSRQEKENKMNNILNKNGITKLDQLNKLNRQKRNFTRTNE